VYVEEVSFRSKSIEGVPTSTTGFAGLTRFGPVQYPQGPTTTEARLITSFTEFERVYGGLESLMLEGNERVVYTAHAARAFFANGGKRLYVSRVFAPRDVGGNDDWGVARRGITFANGTATWRARWPGAYGNVWVDVIVQRSKNVAFANAAFGGALQAKGAKAGSIVEIFAAGAALPDGNDALTPASLAEISIDPLDGRQIFNRGGAAFVPNPTDQIQLVQLAVSVFASGDRQDFYQELGTHPAQKRYIGKILHRDTPEDENAVVWLDWDPTTAVGNDAAANLMVALHTNAQKRLDGGHDGTMTPPDLGQRVSFAGLPADPDVATVKATGLAALGEIDEIAIVALPDAGDLGDLDTSFTAHQALITHCETLKYRMAVVDGPVASSLTQIRNYRGRFDSKYAALYHPWIEILDPNERASQGAPPRRLLLPPSGFVAGIYARSDIERGVHKAPANEVVLGLTKFEMNINKARNDVLNPQGINALRFFEGRGNRVWGARTMSSDPEWKYVNVRRLFIYIEHSIDKATQWAVFEPNNDRLWANIRNAVEDFLLVLWRDGALLGTKPEEAFFVRCDRTTMTQNDLDNGRLICLIGVAPTYPAEFVIFRIGQWTADARMS
jgi:hypothetical protein